jgi:replicative DNA helicase
VSAKRKTLATYDYVDERCELLFQVVRYDPKDFRQRRPDGNGGWTWDMNGTRRVLFRLDGLIAHLSANSREPIYIVEGEKDVLAIEAAGGTATCNPMGAGKWDDAYAEMLAGARRVIVVQDDDEIGERHARDVVASLGRFGVVAEHVRPAVGKDASDHLAAGGTLDDFEPVPLQAPPVIAPEVSAAPTSRRRAVDGATFVNDVPDKIPVIWGDETGAAWAKGEPLMIVGPDGVGKTSVAQQTKLARLGIRDRLLGMKVEPAPGRVLYIAADRPRQAASSLRRMVTAADEETLRDRLIVWKGPLEFDLTKSPGLLREFVDSFDDVSDVIIDSLKDLVPDLSKDETGSRVAMAFQELVASGYELLVNHHQRKEQQGGGKPRRLADVYGSRWLTACMGSVLLLWGEPGDLVVELRHLKQPEGEIGPLNVLHDHAHGRTEVHQSADLLQALANAKYGLTVTDAAQLIFETTNPSPNEIEKARRRLNKLTDTGRAIRRDDPDGLARYFDPEMAA